MPFNYNSVKKITNDGIVDASLTGDDFASGAVNAAAVAAGDITGDKINAANITSGKINDASITETAIADGAVSLSGSIPTGTLPVANGGTALTSTAADRTLMVNNSGNENSFGDQLRSVSNYTFTIRYLSSLTAKKRISYNSKFFNITHITSLLEGKEKYQIISAEEGVAT